MMRAIVILIAALAVMLVYPSTDLLAKSPTINEPPSIHIITSQDGVSGPPGSLGTNDDDGDSGDVDDIAGLRDNDKIKGTKGNTLDAGFDRARLIVKIWWMFLFHRLF